MNGTIAQALQRRRSLPLCCLLAAVLVGCAIARNPSEPIPIEANAPAVAISGQLSESEPEYSVVLRINAPGVLTVSSESAGAIRVYVRTPSGNEEGMPGQGAFTVNLAERGNYLLVVNESRAGERWNAPFRVTLSLRK